MTREPRPDIDAAECLERVQEFMRAEIDRYGEQTAPYQLGFSEGMLQLEAVVNQLIADILAKVDTDTKNG